MNAIAKSFLCLVCITTLMQPSIRAEGEPTAPQAPLVIRGDANDLTPLMAFAGLGDIDACKVLLDAGTSNLNRLPQFPSCHPQ